MPWHQLHLYTFNASGDRDSIDDETASSGVESDGDGPEGCTSGVEDIDEADVTSDTESYSMSANQNDEFGCDEDIDYMDIEVMDFCCS